MLCQIVLKFDRFFYYTYIIDFEANKTKNWALTCNNVGFTLHSESMRIQILPLTITFLLSALDETVSEFCRYGSLLVVAYVICFTIDFCYIVF